MIVVTKMMTFLYNYVAGFGSDPPIDKDLDSVLVPNPQNRSATSAMWIRKVGSKFGPGFPATFESEIGFGMDSDGMDPDSGL